MPRQNDIEHAIRAGTLLPGMTFEQKVWTLTARIPPGAVTTYGQIARALGSRAYRAVGRALNRNPYAPAVPCHRVVGAGGRLTGFAHGLAQKKQLLQSEGVPFVHDRVDPAAITPPLPLPSRQRAGVGSDASKARPVEIK